MRRMVPLMVVTMLIGAPFVAFVSQMATVVFDGDERSTSLLVAAQGVGAVDRRVHARVGDPPLRAVAGHGRFDRRARRRRSCSTGRRRRCGSRRSRVAGCGFGYGVSFTTFAGLSQQAASEDMRGRVLAVNTFILGALYPLGALVQGWLSDRIGLQWVTAGSGVVLAICLAWRLAVITRRRPSAPTPVQQGLSARHTT